MLSESDQVVLLSINDGEYASKIYKKLDYSMGYIFHILKCFERDGILKREKKGRAIILKLTLKGIHIQSYLFAVRELLHSATKRII